MKGNRTGWLFLGLVAVIALAGVATVLYLAGIDVPPEPVEIVFPDERFEDS